MVETIKSPKKKTKKERFLNWCDRNLGKIIVGLDVVAGAILVGSIGYNKGFKRADNAYYKLLNAADESGLLKAHHFDGTPVNMDSHSDCGKWVKELETVAPKKL